MCDCAVTKDPACRRLQQRRSQTDPLKRVLLTTQMKVRVNIKSAPKNLGHNAAATVYATF